LIDKLMSVKKDPITELNKLLKEAKKERDDAKHRLRMVKERIISLKETLEKFTREGRSG
jgi:uncharacterized coiled-coil protein SlyX